MTRFSLKNESRLVDGCIFTIFAVLWFAGNNNLSQLEEQFIGLDGVVVLPCVSLADLLRFRPAETQNIMESRS